MKKIEELANTFTPWVNFHLERWRDTDGRILDYWRVERVDSIIILPIHRECFLFPKPQFRVGLSMATLDFPGGRLAKGAAQDATAVAILERELGASKGSLEWLEPLNTKGWAVDSSFSNQRLWVFIAGLKESFKHDPKYIGACYPTNQDGCSILLKKIECLQCRAALLEWMCN
jgi:hypothetical protein